MNLQRTVRRSPSAYQATIQQFETALERETDRRRNDPAVLRLEEEKLTHLRLALFGSAPK